MNSDHAEFRSWVGIEHSPISLLILLGVGNDVLANYKSRPAKAHVLVVVVLLVVVFGTATDMFGISVFGSSSLFMFSWHQHRRPWHWLMACQIRVALRMGALLRPNAIVMVAVVDYVKHVGLIRL
jgi:hypothetical protein